MPLQNRVTPSGEIIAHSARGLFMGNRGILHDPERRLGRARWRHPHWLICRLEFRGRRREVMRPHAYTELFFLDEATALAAGHRPCAECRREAFRAFRAAWSERRPGGEMRASDLDKDLHRSRVEPRSRRQVTHRAPLAALPDGAFVALDEDPTQPWLVHGDWLLGWRAGAYGPARQRAYASEVCVLTPRPTVAALAAGYRPVLHTSALD